MTLRGRLTTAFLAVVLGPVLLGAFFVGSTVAAVSHDRSVDRLGLAATSVRTSVGALCRQLRAAADAVAVVAERDGRATVAEQIVTGGLATAVVVADASGTTTYQTPGAPPQPWLDCAGAAWTSAAPMGLRVRVEMHDPRGSVRGSVIATQVLDHAFVARLAAATGVEVTLLYAGTGTAAGYSTEPDGVRALVAAAARSGGDDVTRTSDGRYVLRVGPSRGQPVPLALSAPPDGPPVPYGMLVGTVLLAGSVAVLAAWWLARSTTHPLAELAEAAERVAGGDLAARVPVRSSDEVGHLASTFNRMTRETQSYVQALTASRDQLRGHVAILGNTLSSTHDLQRILAVILQTARAATSARAGIVLLLDPATGTLVGKVAEGLDEREPQAGRPPEHRPPRGPGGCHPEPAAVTVPLGSGLLGTVAATGEPQRGRVDRDQPVLFPAEPRCHTYIAVPVSAAGPTGEAAADNPGWLANPPRVQGVLALYDRLGDEEFDDRDLVTLRTFAAQAAVAVDNVRLHHEAQRLSLTDPLTGLWNYRYLKTVIRREVELANRYGRVLAVLALDLDRFKEVNDTHGHAAGDAVLIEFARRIRAEVREVDVAFRQGGEEFIVLLPETDARGGAVVAERLGAAVRATPVMVPVHGGPPDELSPVVITVSIGVAVYPDHASSARMVLDAADDALYAAKAAGRDTYRVATAPPGPAGDQASAASPAGPGNGLPWTGRRRTEGPVASPAGGTGGRTGGAGGASSAPHPPRQGRGR